LNSQGVEQGDPLSAILFNFVVDVLTVGMLIKAVGSDHTRGLSSYLCLGGVINLQYGNDNIPLAAPGFGRWVFIVKKLKLI
jgi:hypothetical protein